MAKPFRRLVLDRVGSTNREAFALAACGQSGPLWIVARRQTAGRGRSGRQWASEPGNLHASLLVELACAPQTVPQLSLLAGVATIDAIRAVGGGPAGLRLKWPNDVLIGPAKCAGILAESTAGEHSITAVIGIGINLAWHPWDLGRAATHLAAEHGPRVSPNAMLGHLDEAMQHWLAAWSCGAEFARVRRAWLERAGAAGEQCTVDTGSERVNGTFVDLDSQGGLVIRDGEGRHRTVTFGDVALAPAAHQEGSR